MAKLEEARPPREREREREREIGRGRGVSMMPGSYAKRNV
jgi:hypothetical protein